MAITHYVDDEYAVWRHGATTAVCGALVSEGQTASHPSCRDCQDWCDDQEQQIEALRRMPSQPVTLPPAFDPCAGYTAGRRRR